MPSTTYVYRQSKGLCVQCGRIRKRRGWVQCELCRQEAARYHAMVRSVKAPRSLAERVRQHRTALGYTQSQYGSMLGITGDRVGELERGTSPRRPSRDLQERLAALLKCSVADLGFS